ncbi:MAG: hypothetical protein HQ494_10445 [Rhodospirillales bacterium]|nr:hypothetical protein [Rhodospirillales bacterium]
MSRYLFICVALMLSVVVAPSQPAQAQTDACQTAEREMEYGRVALEDAKDKKGFLESASQFKMAATKAPNCAQAHFNLGLVYEKAGEYQKAIGPLQTYLKLAPTATDVAQVKKKIYALEYRAKKAKIPRAPKPADLEGFWRTKGRSEPISVTAKGDWLEFDSFVQLLDWEGAGKGLGKKLKFRLNGYQLEGTGHKMDIESEGDDPGQSRRINCLREFIRKGVNLDKGGSTWRTVPVHGQLSQDFKSIVFRFTDLVMVVNECRFRNKVFSSTIYR